MVLSTWVLLNPAPKKPPVPPSNRVAASADTTAPLAAAPLTASDAATTDALAVAADGTTVPRAQRPGPVTTITTRNYAIAFDQVGAVIRSLRLLDPGSASFEPGEHDGKGIELIRTLPTKDPRQVLPLELSVGEPGAARDRYEAFNHVQWEARVVSPGGGDQPAVVQFDSPVIGGLRIRKTLTVPADAYLSEVQVTVFNESGNRVSIGDGAPGQLDGMALRWGPGLTERAAGEMDQAEAAYDAALARNNGEVTVLRPGVDDAPVALVGDLTWGGVESKFFTALLIPRQPDDAARRQAYGFRAWVPAAHKAEVRGYHPPLVAEVGTPRFEIEPGGSRTLDFLLYVGPKKEDVLEKYNYELESAMFPEAFFFMRPIYLGLTDFLNWLYGFVRNYGIAIILLTMIVRLVVFPLTQKQIKIQARTMAEMARIKPHLDEINEKYKDDRMERDRRIWQVYKEHNVSPFAPMRGCLPLLLQMPIFIGLYRVTNDTIDLQGANFLWINDLSLADHLFRLPFVLPIIGGWFNLLPFIMGATQMIATKVGMKRAVNMDPTQKQMMYFMPVILTFMLYTLPAGLMIYWCTSNIWQIFQTMVTNRMMDKEEEKHKAEAAARAAAKAEEGEKSSAASEFKAQEKKKGGPDGGGTHSVHTLPDKKKR